MRRLVGAVVGLHVVTALVHGGLHVSIPVALQWWQSVIVVTTVLVGPLLGGWFAVRGRPTVAGPVIALSLFVAFWFELTAHFLVANPDYVGTVQGHHASFAVTAALSVLTDAVGVVIGIVYWWTCG